jgi:signal transduction histidine kinase
MLEAAAHARRITILVEPSAPILAQGDARGVTQILVNLLGNAVRHSPKRGSISISFDRADGNVRVHVADQGPGIDPADQQRIFERFERGSGEEGGTGLGLAIARRLAHAMGGDIQLESAPGEGAKFSLVLPAV